ncbi:hypothetical protein PRVXT_002196 [Proteinivorax tanatarense]|uniref:ATLF-like domain-containing protein n=1 Tax=Proteinivorax tanatarense TaxID=1260629 RepID=A0AAU7VJ78_9FIRM
MSDEKLNNSNRTSRSNRTKPKKSLKRKLTLLVVSFLSFLLIITGIFSSILLFGYEGRSNIYYPDGSIKFKGDIDSGLPNGKGVLYSEHGQVIAEGQFKDGKLHEYGTLYKNGYTLYTGDFKYGLPHGFGSSYYKEQKLKYEGEWEKGHKNGQGKLFDADNNLIFNGEFKDNKFNGNGKYYYNEQLIYKGQWKDHARHGQGKEFDKNDLIYDGQWSNNYYSGHGKFFADEKVVYKGVWDYGLPNGEGKLYNPKSEKVFTGTWVDGKVTYGQFFYDEKEVVTALNNVIVDNVHRHIMMLQLYEYTLFDLFNTTTKQFESCFLELNNLSSVIEPASEDILFKSLMYKYIEVPQGSYNKQLLTNIIKEIENIPLPILEDLVAAGVTHRFIYGHIAYQPEFDWDDKTNAGTLREANPVGLASYKHNLLITRLDISNPFITTLHEIGHAVDHYLLYRTSEKDEFKNIFSKEATTIFNHSWYDLTHFTDNSDEYFAEGFASYYISEDRAAGYTPTIKEIEEYAPKTYDFFEKHLDGHQANMNKFTPEMAATVDRSTHEIKHIKDNSYTYHVYSLNQESIQISAPKSYHDVAFTILKEGITFRPLKAENSIYLLMDRQGSFFINTNKVNSKNDVSALPEDKIPTIKIERNTIFEQLKGGYKNFTKGLNDF